MREYWSDEEFVGAVKELMGEYEVEMLGFLEELWVNEEVAGWAEEQEEHDVRELWFVIQKGGTADDGIALNPDDCPATYRMN